MAEIPKLAPEVEVPRPRSSGVALVAVAALAMFTAIGASAFVVRARMASTPCATHRMKSPPIAARHELREAFLSAAARHDDTTALEIYRGLPAGLDPTGELERIYRLLVTRQLELVERDLARGDCDALRPHLALLRRVAPEENISVRVGECVRTRIEVDLVQLR
jgi:hypothetical protein